LRSAGGGVGAIRTWRYVARAPPPTIARDEVVRTLMRLVVTGRLVETERKYRLATRPVPDLG
jgi:hypothetical protein